MKILSYQLKSATDIDACLRDFSVKSFGNPRSVYACLFVGLNDKKYLLSIYKKIKERLPQQAHVVGIPSAGGIYKGGMSLHSVVLSFFLFERTDIALHKFDFSLEDPKEAANRLIVSAQLNSSLAGIHVGVARHSELAYIFLNRLNKLPPHVAVFGGIAGKTEIKNTFIFVDGEFIDNGAYALCLQGNDLNIQISISVGWTPLGPAFKVTSMIGSNIVETLDSQPSKSIYEKYLDISVDSFDAENMLFPVCLERNGQTVLRHPAGLTETGGILLHGDCKVGEQVRLAYGDPIKIMNALRDVQEKCVDFSPEGIAIFTCTSRRIFLNTLTNKALSPFMKIAHSTGFYTAGEIARDGNGMVSLFNMTFVAVSFREGAPRNTVKRTVLPPQHPLTGTMKLVQHLTRFIATTSLELEEANKRLVQLATMDQLTGLYNRAQIEAKLKKMFKTDVAVTTLAAIMIDLDDFKHINDTFGHMVGDDVLRSVGEIIRKNTRKSDASGRWGGEEFFIILPQTSAEVAKSIAERIRRCIADGYILPDGNNITASLGVASLAKGSSYMNFYHIIDGALYSAKENGKNQTVVANSAPPLQ